MNLRHIKGMYKFSSITGFIVQLEEILTMLGPCNDV